MTWSCRFMRELLADADLTWTEFVETLEVAA